LSRRHCYSLIHLGRNGARSRVYVKGRVHAKCAQPQFGRQRRDPCGNWRTAPGSALERTACGTAARSTPTRLSEGVGRTVRPPQLAGGGFQIRGTGAAFQALTFYEICDCRNYCFSRFMDRGRQLQRRSVHGRDHTRVATCVRCDRYPYLGRLSWRVARHISGFARRVHP
jgi:hypothetical protein